MGKVDVKGSERKAVEGGRDLGALAEGSRIEVTLRLRRKVSGSLSDRLDDLGRPQGSAAHLSREEFAAELGASEADIERVEAFAAEHALDVVESHAGGRTVVLGGTVRDVSDAFGVALRQRLVAGRVHRVREGAVQIPEALADVVVAVLGLDDRPVARPMLHRGGVRPRASATPGGYFPEALAKPYGFPEGLTGAGQTVAVIELGGGYHLAEMRRYFRSRGLPTPRITSVGVRGAHNRPEGDLGGDDGEVVLDVQVLGALAPGASIVVYFAPNTDDGFLAAILAAVHDKRRRPSVVSISWGGPESSWTAQSLRAFDEAFQEAALMGVTVCAAAGDNGSSDGASDGRAHVDFPASSPYVVACGGTRLQGDVETVWNNGPNSATGGGVSSVFPRPAWQSSASVPMALDPPGFAGRALPDVAANADPETGYRIAGDGVESVIGGTSAVAPLMAALVARFNEHLSRSRPQGQGTLGLPHPALYRQPAGSFRDIVKGNNGAFSARPGWDACTGLGSPIGTCLLQNLGTIR